MKTINKLSILFSFVSITVFCFGLAPLLFFGAIGESAPKWAYWVAPFGVFLFGLALLINQKLGILDAPM